MQDFGDSAMARLLAAQMKPYVERAKKSLDEFIITTIQNQNKMERVENISQLKQGDKIFSISNDGGYSIIEFREIHPYHSGYSLFLNQNKDGMPKFYNDDLVHQKWYRFDDSDECWKFIAEQRIKKYEHIIDNIALRYQVQA